MYVENCEMHYSNSTTVQLETKTVINLNHLQKLKSQLLVIAIRVA